MDFSIFFAKFFGIYLLFACILWIMKRDEMPALFEEMRNNPWFLMYGGVFTFMFGLFIVLTHSVWSLDWRLIITVIGYMTLLKGVLLTLYPKFLIDNTRGLIEGFPNKIMIGTIAFFGVFLTYIGFFCG